MDDGIYFQTVWMDEIRTQTVWAEKKTDSERVTEGTPLQTVWTDEIRTQTVWTEKKTDSERVHRTSPVLDLVDHKVSKKSQVGQFF